MKLSDKDKDKEKDKDKDKDKGKGKDKWAPIDVQGNQEVRSRTGETTDYV